jgi:hypothetical protein
VGRGVTPDFISKIESIPHICQDLCIHICDIYKSEYHSNLITKRYTSIQNDPRSERKLHISSLQWNRTLSPQAVDRGYTSLERSVEVVVFRSCTSSVGG